MPEVQVRKGQPSVALTREEFAQRYRSRFYDPVFAGLQAEIDKLVDAAWDGYEQARKSPRTRPAGADFADPAFELPLEWLATRDAVREAQRVHDDPASPSRVLVVNGSTRSDQTCPGEISKTFRLAQIAQETIAAESGFEVDFLDLSRLAAEYGRVIYPCKACVSTAQPLCHWPCSCYPNHALGQTGDWMNELYPRWIRAHGVIVLCPVNWYQAPSSLKLMIDRLVCADGGNPDPTSTQGKDPKLAKELELRGWPYPRHLAGRGFAVVVHGDAAGVENLRRILCDWMSDIGMVQAGKHAAIGAFVGYLTPYATSHDDLDRDRGIMAETGNAAKALVAMVHQLRSGYRPADAGLHEPRPK
jgi:multimeric flavodoxin WrbA